MRLDVNLRVLGQDITSDKRELASDSVNSIYAVFYFSSEWEGLTKYVTFSNLTSGVNKLSNALENDECKIPWEVLTTGVLNIYVEGVKTSDSINLTTLKMNQPIKVSKSGKTSDTSEPLDPTDDFYVQITGLVEDAMSVAKEIETTEGIRVTAENERVIAENLRDSAEDLRQSNTSSAISDATAATERANVAAQACENIVIEKTGINDNGISDTESWSSNKISTFDIKDNIVTITEASQDAELTTGSKLSVLIGIIKKKFNLLFASKGVANGLATLDANGLIPQSQLPSYVDDVIEGAMNEACTQFTVSGTIITPETGKIYVDISSGTHTNKSFRWSGTVYVEISKSLAIGVVAGTAYDGAAGKENADAITVLTNNLTTLTQEYAEQSITEIGLSIKIGRKGNTGYIRIDGFPSAAIPKNAWKTLDITGNYKPIGTSLNKMCIGVSGTTFTFQYTNLGKILLFPRSADISTTEAIQIYETFTCS